MYIGTPQTYKLYKEGKNPSHWLYGAVEMEKSGHVVYWEKEKQALLNDVKLYFKYRPDIIFIPNLNLRAHLLLLLVSSVKLVRKPIFAYLHHSPVHFKGIWKRIFKFAFRGINHLFFLSELTMKETINAGFVHPLKATYIRWGADIDFYKQFDNVKEDDVFVSTGKENRDYNMLIDVFKKTNKKLKIITCKKHADREYTSLEERRGNAKNINVTLIENSGSAYPSLVREMKKSKFILCPIIPGAITYCVGLSSILDAEALGKRIIITSNPYHDDTRLKFSIVCKNQTDWERCITSNNVALISPPTMEPVIDIWHTYNQMRTYMGL